jgi:hypothetical protein
VAGDDPRPRVDAQDLARAHDDEGCRQAGKIQAVDRYRGTVHRVCADIANDGVLDDRAGPAGAFLARLVDREKGARGGAVRIASADEEKASLGHGPDQLPGARMFEAGHVDEVSRVGEV